MSSNFRNTSDTGTGYYRPTTTSASLDGLSRRLPPPDQIGNRYQRLLDSKHEDADLRRGFYVTPLRVMTKASGSKS